MSSFRLTPKQRRHLSAALREVYHLKCQYCEEPNGNEVEHIVPRSRGGRDDLDNVTLACKRCNVKKSALELPQMYEGILLARAKERATKILAVIDRYTGEDAKKGHWERVDYPVSGDIVFVWITDPVPTWGEDALFWAAVKEKLIEAGFGHVIEKHETRTVCA